MRRDVFQAIADPNRRAILDLLVTREMTLNEISKNFNISRPAVSKHIKILTESGLIEIEKKGRQRYCRVKIDKLNDVSVWVERYRLIWEEKLDALEEYLNVLQKKENNNDRNK
ncbi:MAG: winged helix-turn-helix transcriptional regulator [Ignavibacteriae bacterium]|nr:winged helix-turn-helix transcriptional regulator [Ignavibacteriota bacterium]